MSNVLWDVPLPILIQYTLFLQPALLEILLTQPSKLVHLVPCLERPPILISLLVKVRLIDFMCRQYLKMFKNVQIFRRLSESGRL